MLKPKLVSLIKHKNYSLAQFYSDCFAGIIVGIVALPLAIAFAIASGVSPEKGIITAIVGGFIVAILGGSRVQIAGPTGAFVVIVYGIVQKFGLEGLYISTFMAGIVLVILGLARIGSMIKFMPHPVIVGFTSGIAVIILSSQIKDFLGLKMGHVPPEFFQKWIQYFQNISSINLDAFLIGAGTICLIIVWRKFSQKIPGPLVALVLATFGVQFLRLPVDTIGSRFGEIPHHFPPAVIPNISLETIIPLIPSIFAIALLGGIESLLSAVVADGMIEGKHRPNMEFIAQGIANVASPIFGGIPVTGAIARTATNVNSGGRTPIAGIVHSVFLLLVMLFFAKWVKYIPLSCLAGILVLVAYNMSEWRSFLKLCKISQNDMIVLLGTFLVTVMVDLIAGILIGIILAIVLGKVRKVVTS
jgi:SulP family sulfate permease